MASEQANKMVQEMARVLSEKREDSFARFLDRLGGHAEHLFGGRRHRSKEKSRKTSMPGKAQDKSISIPVFPMVSRQCGAV